MGGFKVVGKDVPDGRKRMLLALGGYNTFKVDQHGDCVRIKSRVVSKGFKLGSK